MARPWIGAGLLWAAMAAFPLGAADRLSLGTASFPMVEKFLTEVRQSLDAEVFHLTDKRLVRLIGQAAAQGASVRIILDPGQGRNRQTAADLAKASPRIQVRWMATDPHTGQLMHCKAACADGRSLLIGSANWTHSGMNLNQEALAVLDDPGVSLEFEAVFERDWQAARPEWPSRKLRDEELQSLPDPGLYYQEEPKFNRRHK
jgi:cardiolipin synthase